MILLATRLVLPYGIGIKLELDELKDIMTEFGVSMPDEEVREMFADVRDTYYVTEMYRREVSQRMHSNVILRRIPTIRDQ